MKALFRYIKNFTKNRLNRQFYVFLVCLLVSTFIWLLISLSKNYTTFVELPVQYSSFPKGKVVTNELPETVKLEVNAYGFNLLSYKLFSREQELKIDVGELKNRTPFSAYLSTQEIIHDLSEQFPDQTKILSVHPDTISIQYVPQGSKKVKVKPDVQVDFKRQFDFSGEIQTRPPTVEVLGPASVLDTLRYVKTNPLQFSEVDETITKHSEIRLEDKVKGLQVKPSRVLVTIPVDEFTEGTMIIGLQLREGGADRTVKTYPDSVRVNYLVAFDRYDQVKNDMFRAVVDIPNSEEKLRELSKLKVKLVNRPAFVKDVRFEPQKVEFIIRQK